jgi:monovalent cation/hydrogen antiporter
MFENGVHEAQIVLLALLLLATVSAALARKLQTAYPIVLVIAGLLLSFVPGIPKVALDPEMIFLVVLPPLLFFAAWVTSWSDLRNNSGRIAMLAFGLVAFTVLGVALAGPLLFPGFDWRIGFALGAVVATTDAIAATSIAKRIGLPKRIVDLLEGESLINDATGLLALEFATGMLVLGQTPTVGAGLARLLYLTIAGVAVGLIIGRLVEWFEYKIDDGPIEIAISIIVPYAAYLATEAIHGSGVLAVVAAGLYLGRKSSKFLSPAVRLQSRAVWDSLTFILNGFVFVLIGLQLPFVLAGVSELSPGRLILYSGMFSLFLIILRLAWTFPSAYAAFFVRKHLFHRTEPRPAARQVFVVGWTGMRGVIALAAAISLPETLADGSPFPHRNLIIFLTFSVILVTLVFQGLTLPPLIRALGLARTSTPSGEEQEARRLALEAALTRLETIRGRDPQSLAVYDDLARHYRHRLAAIGGDGDPQERAYAGRYAQYLHLSRSLLNVERETALRLRDEGRITDEVLREMEQELDLSETQMAAAISFQRSEMSESSRGVLRSGQ